MFTSFNDVERHILSLRGKKKIALAGSQDPDALGAAVNARRRGVADLILIGDPDKTGALLEGMNESPSDYVIIAENNDKKAANKACAMAKSGEADIPMKGLMHTSTFMRAILDKELGFVPEKGLLSQATVLEAANTGRMMVISDCAVNIAPNYEEKVKIVDNAVVLTRKLGVEKPLVAVLAPVETVNPAMPATIEAAMLSKAADRGQIKNCVIDGPLALDNAVSLEAAEHKGIKSPVAGKADILIMPDLNAGNIFTKSLVYFGNNPSAGCLCGTTSAVIMTSRSDTEQNKYFAILVAILQSYSHE